RTVDTHLFFGAFNLVVLALTGVCIWNATRHDKQRQPIQSSGAWDRPREQHAHRAVAAGDELFAASDPPRAVGLPSGAGAEVTDVGACLWLGHSYPADDLAAGQLRHPAPLLGIRPEAQNHRRRAGRSEERRVGKESRSE